VSGGVQAAQGLDSLLSEVTASLEQCWQCAEVEYRRRNERTQC
jgi:hypothetical protein